MDTQFIAIIQKLIAERGKETLFDTAKCKAFLADYTKGEYNKESRLLLQAVEAGAAKNIAETTEPESCKAQMIKKLQVDHFLSDDAAADVVGMLALVLRENAAAQAVDEDEWESATVETAPQAASEQPTADQRYAEEISVLNKTIAEKDENLTKAVQEVERLNAEIQRYTKENNDLQKSIADKNEETERLTGGKNNENFRLTGDLAKTKKRLKVVIVAGAIALAVSIGVGWSQYGEMEGRYYGQLSSYNTLSTSYGQWRAFWKILVTSIKVGNSDNNNKWLTNPGGSLNAGDIRFLKPVITYSSSISREVTFYVKIIQPNGSISRNTAISPAGYTYSTKGQVSSGDNLTFDLTSWGNKDTSIYAAGEYTIEVWHEGVCLRSEKVKLN